MSKFTPALVVTFIAVVSTISFLRDGANVCVDCVVINPLFSEILTNTAQAPYAYRVLSPAILQALGGGVIAYVLFHLLSRIALFGLLHTWARYWQAGGLATVAIFAVALELAYGTWYSGDYALTECVLVLASWIVMACPRVWWQVPIIATLIILGTLNREATGFIILCSWLVLYWKDRMLASGLMVACAGLTFYGLRIVIDAPPNAFTPDAVLVANLTEWRLNGAIFYYAVLVPLIAAIALSWWNLPPVYMRMCVAILPYVALILTVGVWQEIRLLLPVLALVLPLLSKQSA